MPSPSRTFGDSGEALAEQFLRRSGHRIIDRNYQRPWGEIDLIAEKDAMIVFCEVKTRKGVSRTAYLPEDSITKAKQRRLKKTCETYLSEKRFGPDQLWRIDVIAIILKEGSEPIIRHLENAIWQEQY